MQGTEEKAMASAAQASKDAKAAGKSKAEQVVIDEVVTMGT